MSGTDYTHYLQIDRLLDLQRPLTREAHDEMLFVVIHQVYELWFKVMLHELDSAVTVLGEGGAAVAAARLRRAVRIDELLIHQLFVLESMSPEGFLEFRDPLKPASGLQSGQFRAIEYLGGIRDEVPDGSALSEYDLAELSRRRTLPTMYEALCACLRHHGVDAPNGDDDAARTARLTALASLYRDHSGTDRALLHEVCELFVDHDEAIARWRFHHTLMAAREIGTRHGTGGSLGVDYLRSTVDRRFFPELWEVRALL